MGRHRHLAEDPHLSGPHVIAASGLTKRYGAIAAVDDLSFEVERGETFALIGPNGAGKTTTLKLVLGLAQPDSGTVRIGAAGRPPHDPATRRRLGYVPQRIEFPAGRTVTEVLGFFAELRGLPREAVARALERTDLARMAGRRASELSGGITQRLSLAQALLGDPEALVLDEPTASLDPQATWEFRTLIEQLRRHGTTILLCSHLLAEVERVADRVLIMIDGRRAALESLGALRARQTGATRLALDVGLRAPRAREVLADAGIAVESVGDGRLALAPGDLRGPEALAALRSAGVDLRGIEVLRPTLEESFLEVVRRNGERTPAPAAAEAIGAR